MTQARNSRDRSSQSEVQQPGRSNSATTLKDIARVAGVSAQTVSCVINNSGSVSENVRARIRQIAQEMGYSPNKSAKAMRTGRSQTLALVISDMSNPFYPELAQSVERAAAAMGYAVLLVDMHDSSLETAERIAALNSHPVDGVIATEYSPALDRLSVPTVLIGGPVAGKDCVNADDAAGGRLLADYLLEQGHRTFGLVTTPLVGCVPIRRKGFLDRVTDEAEIVWEGFTADGDSVSPEIRLLLAREDVTAIVCSQDLIAIRTLRVLRELGRDVPGDVSVVGFDDIPWAGIVTPPLTTIRQPYVGLGAEAVSLLIKRIGNPKRRCRHLRLGVDLVERESVAPSPVVGRGGNRKVARLRSEAEV